jgi:hypothetical protein
VAVQPTVADLGPTGSGEMTGVDASGETWLVPLIELVIKG